MHLTSTLVAWECIPSGELERYVWLAEHKVQNEVPCIAIAVALLRNSLQSLAADRG